MKKRGFAASAVLAGTLAATLPSLVSHPASLPSGAARVDRSLAATPPVADPDLVRLDLPPRPAPPARASRNRTTDTPTIAQVWFALIKCEATTRGWRYGAPGVGIDPGYRFEGGLNFTHDSWVEYGGTRYAEHAWDATPVQQVTVAKRVLRVQGPHAWPVCGPKVGLSRSDAD